MRLDTKNYWLTDRQLQCDFDFWLWIWLLRESPETALRKVGDSCEMDASLRGLSTGAEERPLLGNVTQQRSE
jgi:hypothetical protein